MPHSVWFTTNTLADDPIERYCRDIVDWCWEDLRKRVDSHRFTPASAPSEADLVVFIESPRHKFWEYADILQSNDLIRRYPDRCFAFSWEDVPAGFLPGVYMSLCSRDADPARFQSGFPFRIHNTKLDTGGVAKPPRGAAEPRLLASFRGAASSSVRERLFAMTTDTDDISVTRIRKWFDHDENDLREYADEIFDSKFVLCPRGVGTSTFRLFETLAAGRVPVILADDWVPPSGPAWNAFTIRLSEDRVDEIRDVLHDHEPLWREMACQARAAYDTWFARPVVVQTMLQAVAEISLRRPRDHREADFHAQWKSLQFGWKHHWTLPQKIHEIYRNGQLTTRVRQKLTLHA